MSSTREGGGDMATASRRRSSCAIGVAAFLVCTACTYEAAGTDGTLEPAGVAGANAGPAVQGKPLPADPPPGTPRLAARQMRAWKRFPVNAAPRPIVLTGTRAHLVGSYADTVSLAFADPKTLPTGPNIARGHPLISADQALDVLHDLAKKHPRSRREVILTKIKLSTGTFWTDRGLQELPAWRVTYTAAGATHPTSATVVILAISPSTWFQGVTGHTAVGVGKDDMSLMVRVPDTRVPQLMGT